MKKIETNLSGFVFIDKSRKKIYNKSVVLRKRRGKIYMPTERMVKMNLTKYTFGKFNNGGVN